MRTTIEVSTQNKVNQYRREPTDFTVDFQGFGFDLNRRYDSLTVGDGLLGIGWALSSREVGIQQRRHHRS